jgi:hypothetical protein
MPHNAGPCEADFRKSVTLPHFVDGSELEIRQSVAHKPHSSIRCCTSDWPVDRPPFGPAIAKYVSFPGQDTSNRPLSGDGRSHEEIEIYDVPMVSVLKVGEARVAVAELTRKNGISRASHFPWQSKYAGVTVDAPNRMKEFEPETLGIEVATSLPSLRVIRIPEQLIERFGHSKAPHREARNFPPKRGKVQDWIPYRVP